MNYTKSKMAIIHFMPSNKKVKARIGSSILNAALTNRVSITHKCNGKCSCTTCKVQIIQGHVSPIQEGEDRLLTEEQKQNQYRLSCQALVTQDVVVQIPEDPLKAFIRAQLSKKEE